MNRTIPSILTAIATVWLLLPSQAVAQQPYAWKPVTSATSAETPALAPIVTAAPGFDEGFAHPGWQPAVMAVPGYGVPLGVVPASYHDPVQQGQGMELGCDDRVACPCPICRTRRPWFHGWGSLDYVFAWTKGRYVPPLVTTSPPDTPMLDAGVLPEARILFGDEAIGTDVQSAGRLDIGIWLDQCDTLGAGLRLFGIEGDRTTFTQRSDEDGLPILAVPYFDVVSQSEASILGSYPGEFAGGVDVHTSNDVINSEAYLRLLLVRGPGYRFDLIGGYQYSNIRDGLDLSIRSIVIDPLGVPPLGTDFLVQDSFDVKNEFHGGMLGVTSEMRYGCWTLRALGKLGVGSMHETVTIRGSTTVTSPPPGSITVVQPGGLFAQRSNIGEYDRDKTVYVPEAGLTLGYNVTRHLQLTLGYTFIYWSDVGLAGDQIDRVVDLRQVPPGPPASRPEFRFRTTDFWVQGVTAGLAWEF